MINIREQSSARFLIALCVAAVVTSIAVIELPLPITLLIGFGVLGLGAAILRPSILIWGLLLFTPFSHAIFLFTLRSDPPLWTEAVVVLITVGLIVQAARDKESIMKGGGAAALVIAFTAASILSFWHSTSFQYLAGLRVVLISLIVFVAGSRLPVDDALRRRMLVGLFAVGVVASTIGIGLAILPVDTLTSLGFKYGFEVRQVGGIVRAFGTFRDPFTFGHFAMIALVASFGMRKYLASSIGRPTLYLGLILLAAAVAMSFVRDAWVGTLLGIGGVEVIRRRFALPYIAACMLLAYGLLVATGVFSSDAAFAQVQGSVSGRLQTWTDLIGEIPQYPFGQGLGTYGAAAEAAINRQGEVARGYDGRSYFALYQAVDSQYLLILIESGPLALILFLLAAGAVIHRARAALGSETSQFARDFATTSVAILFALMVLGVSRNILEETTTGLIFWFIAGVGSSLGSSRHVLVRQGWPQYEAPIFTAANKTT